STSDQITSLVLSRNVHQRDYVGLEDTSLKLSGSYSKALEKVAEGNLVHSEDLSKSVVPDNRCIDSFQSPGKLTISCDVTDSKSGQRNITKTKVENSGSEETSVKKPVEHILDIPKTH
ncbi:hypothetical protein ACH5RR_023397, partial [Cinchona calisaya]